jgi:adenylate cyclase, class 2
MYIEIEAKLKVDSLPEIERRLGELGGEFVAEQAQMDYHFDDSGASLTTTDRCLRIRRESVGPNEKYYLAYKGAKEKSSFKKRQEIEFEISDADTAEKLLGALGYRRVLTIEKRRRLWRLGGCEVALDKLPLLGDYVEIEGPDDARIADVQNSLGLAHVSHVPKSYAQLMKEEQDRRRA